MITKEDIQNLRSFLNTNKRVATGMKMPKNIETIVDELCSMYEKQEMQ